MGPYFFIDSFRPGGGCPWIASAIPRQDNLLPHMARGPYRTPITLGSVEAPRLRDTFPCVALCATLRSGTTNAGVPLGVTCPVSE